MKDLMTIRMVENDEGLIDLMIDPDEVTGAHFDQLLVAIAQVRAQFQPPVPAELARPMEEISVAPEPRWFVGQTYPQGLVVGLRHPGLGWAVFQIPQDFPAQLQTAIDQAVQMAVPVNKH